MRCHQLILIALCACGDGGGFVDAPPAPPTGSGTFSLAWTLTTASQQPETCAQANATTVRLSFADASTGATYGGTFDCTLGDAVTGALFSATYDIGFELAGANGTITTAAHQTATITTNKTTDLQPVAFVTP